MGNEVLEHTSQNVFSLTFTDKRSFEAGLLLLSVRRLCLQIFFDIVQARVESGETGVTGTYRTRLHPWVREV